MIDRQSPMILLDPSKYMYMTVRTARLVIAA